MKKLALLLLSSPSKHIVGLLPDRDKNGEDLVRSGFLDASTFLEQAEMWLQPESYSKFYRFYQLQINENDRYGCHCQMKDLVSQDYIDYQDGRDHFKYFGQPVDPLDKACHNHRECLRCAKMELNCAYDGISEHYLNYKLNKVGYCADPMGSCGRAYCECARQFIVDIHNSAIYSYDEQFSRVVSDFRADSKSCPQMQYSNDQVSLPENARMLEKRNIACCSKEGSDNVGPWRLYNYDRYKCCNDGQVRGQC